MDARSRFGKSAQDRLSLGPTNPAFSAGLSEAFFVQGFREGAICATSGIPARVSNEFPPYTFINCREEGEEVGGGPVTVNSGFSFLNRPSAVTGLKMSGLVRFRSIAPNATTYGLWNPYSASFCLTGSSDPAVSKIELRTRGNAEASNGLVRVSKELEPNRLYTAVATLDDSIGEVRLYVNGDLVGTGTSPPLVYSSGYNDLTAYRSFHPLLLGALWLRALSDSEARALSANPWQLFRTRPRRVFFDAPTPGIPVLSAATITNITTTTARLGGTLTI